MLAEGVFFFVYLFKMAAYDSKISMTFVLFKSSQKRKNKTEEKIMEKKILKVYDTITGKMVDVEVSGV